RAANHAGFVGCDLQLIGGLHRIPLRAGDPPAQPWLQRIDADGIGEVFDAQSADRERGLSKQQRWCKCRQRQSKQRTDLHQEPAATKCGFSMSPIRFPNGSATVATRMPSPTSLTADSRIAPAFTQCATAVSAFATPQ